MQDRVTVAAGGLSRLARPATTSWSRSKWSRRSGRQYLDTYFGQARRLLEPDGLALVQAITIEDHRYEQALRSVDFIKRHVFPGSFIPVDQRDAGRGQDAHQRSGAFDHCEDFGPPMRSRLQAWRQRFLARLDEVRALGYDERFIRMWEFYLATARAASANALSAWCRCCLHSPEIAAAIRDTAIGGAGMVLRGPILHGPSWCGPIEGALKAP